MPPLAIKYHETLGNHGVIEQPTDVAVDTWLGFQRRCVSFGREVVEAGSRCQWNAIKAEGEVD